MHRVVATAADIQDRHVLPVGQCRSFASYRALTIVLLGVAMQYMLIRSPRAAQNIPPVRVSTNARPGQRRAKQLNSVRVLRTSARRARPPRT